MRKPIVSRNLTLTKYRCYIRDRTGVKDVVFTIPHGPKSISKIKAKLNEMYHVIVLNVIETWEEKELRGMTEVDFYLHSSPLTEDRKLKNK